jgi:DNA repair protein RadC
MHTIPVYDVRLVKARRPLRLAETHVFNPRAGARALHALIAMTDREHFAALFVNGAHQIVGAHVIAVGAQHAIGTIDVRVVFRSALAACASAIVLGHNHPSGDPYPSDEDITATAHLLRGAEILSLGVLDHIIVTRDEHRYHSMLEQGTFPAKEK